MNKVIISTKGTTKTLLISGLVSLGIGLVSFLGGAWYIVSKINSYPSYAQDYVASKLMGMLLIFGIVFIIDSAIAGFTFLRTRTYAEVFEDHIEGAGIQQGFKLMNFKLSNEKITNVACNGIDLYIHTNGEKYRVSTDAKTAKAIFDQYHK